MELSKNECHILVIYDIVNNKRRAKYVSYLSGYGYRVQKSCFEAVITKSHYKKIIKESPQYMDKSEDSIRIYILGDKCKITNYGIFTEKNEDKIVLV